MRESSSENNSNLKRFEDIKNLPGSGSSTSGAEKYWNNDSLKNLGFDGGKVEITTDPGLTVFDNTPVVQKQDDKQATEPADPDPPYTFVTRKGEASTVLDKLKKIKFVPGSYGAMSASIAYIRYWKRGGSAQKTAVSQSTTNGTVADSKQQTVDELSRVAGRELKSPSSAWTNPPVISGLNVPALNPENVNYFDKKLTPTNLGFQNSQPEPEKKPEAKNSPSFWSRVGSLISANPSGTSLSSLPGPPSDNGPTSYAAEAAPNPDSAVWQFLFNPEELQLSSGPDFNRAETWGVSDAANHGQPLAWRAHKNRKLTFSKVLLHGYAFGRRVDLLEKGLQDLFMAGSDGPPVLEFVWGKRVFGPCVIQNVQVKEKAWDKGLLVNAEVSFELEQIPEWTINDGFVDVLRPGRQPELNDPRLEAGGMANPTPGDPDAPEPPAKENGGGGGKPVTPPRLQTLKAQQAKCAKAQEIAKEFKTLRKDAGKFATPAYKNSVPTFSLAAKKEKIDGMGRFILTYTNLYNDLLNSVPRVSKLRFESKPEELKRIWNDYYKDVGLGKMSFQQFTIEVEKLFYDVSDSAYRLADEFSLSSTCRDVDEKIRLEEKNKTNSNNKSAQCKGIKEGLPCNLGTSRARIANPCEKNSLYQCVYPKNGRQRVYQKVK